MSDISEILVRQRAFFASGQTRSLAFRLERLKRLRQAINAACDDIVDAAVEDLGRPELEGYMELTVINELDHIIKHLPRWVQGHKARLPVEHWPGSAQVQPEPLGCVLIIGPWNYPFQLITSPLIGAVAAGNCALLKPSEHAPATARVLAGLVEEVFDPGHVCLVQGGAKTAEQLLTQRFDHIFFTGSERVGRLVMRHAAEQLTPVTLELGGKSPCVVERDADLGIAARRIVWGRFLNAGQTCVAPDYLLAHEDVKAPLVVALRSEMHRFYGDDPQTSPDFGRIINEGHLERLLGLLDGAEVVAGGGYDRATRCLEPTLVDKVTWESPLMQEEIFGPILPVLTFRDRDEVIEAVNSRPKPLALYLFSRDRRCRREWLTRTSSGTACVNDVVLQFAVPTLPFGGVGASGIGSYHGHYSFLSFSHQKGVLAKPFWPDVPWRYPPYRGKRWLIRRLLRLG
jgi:aldehyde dehydrogenase (NAD+)